MDTNTEKMNNEECISLEQYNLELEEADSEIEHGDFFVHEEALKEIRSSRPAVRPCST
jgi:hypothetical protein